MSNIFCIFKCNLYCPFLALQLTVLYLLSTFSILNDFVESPFCLWFQRLLTELEEFAFQGCPDVRGAKSNRGAKNKREEVSFYRRNN